MPTDQILGDTAKPAFLLQLRIRQTRMAQGDFDRLLQDLLGGGSVRTNSEKDVPIECVAASGEEVPQRVLICDQSARRMCGCIRDRGILSLAVQVASILNGVTARLQGGSAAPSPSGFRPKVSSEEWETRQLFLAGGSISLTAASIFVRASRMLARFWSGTTCWATLYCTGLWQAFDASAAFIGQP